MLRLTLRPTHPLDIGLTLGMLQRGPYDPTTRVSARDAVRATRTPDGAATLHIRGIGDRIEVSAYGAGAGHALERVGDLLGMEDDPRAFVPHDPRVRDAHRRCIGMRLGRTGNVIECLIPSILEQKVTSVEAHRSYRRLVRRFGEPAPGPFGLMVQPAPEQIAVMPVYALHPLGVEGKRAATLVRACGTARRLQEAAQMPFEQARARLTAMPGIGEWTAAEVGRDALGDPDTVSVGDFHLKNIVAWVLAGEPRATDERMLELLEPYAGMRTRAVRLIEQTGLRPPRYGPRVKMRAIERI